MPTTRLLPSVLCAWMGITAPVHPQVLLLVPQESILFRVVPNVSNALMGTTRRLQDLKTVAYALPGTVAKILLWTQFCVSQGMFLLLAQPSA